MPIQRYPFINPKFPFFFHGGDYNPEQWRHIPGTIDEDFRLAKLAHINSFSVGIFSWVNLEPEEGLFVFDWLDDIMERMANDGMAAVLATPSGARPAWMSFKYPEVLRVGWDGQRAHHDGRHNHCFTSPIYREKVALINGKLAERYANHPALAVWHLSNEYSGECHCELCYAAFREWLQAKYGTLDALNQAWWTAFWSHTFTAWSQIEPRDFSIHGLKLDWMRFTTDQTVDFMRHEIAALRQFSTDTPVTTNMMGTFPGLDYWKFAPYVDVISWDCYPSYHREGDAPRAAASVSFSHDINRCMRGGQPFMLMESSPSVQNWQPINKLKPPGMHKLIEMQAVAHGADTVQYFQYRKSRGGCEKFHGAVVDHVGHENTRVFGEVTQVGELLEKLAPVLGTTAPAEVALIFDWENRWALEAASGPRQDKQYQETCEDHYRPFWSRGVPVDVINADAPFEGYKLLVAPMLYMLRPGVAERIAAFVQAGGTFVATHLTGIADENDLCFPGGWPGPLREVLGIRVEEIDALYDDESNTIIPVPSAISLSGNYTCRTLCDVVHLETAKAIASYGQGWYAHTPCVTVNQHGEGRAYYVATRANDAFMHDFYGALIKSQGVRPATGGILPHGVTAQVRTDGEREFVFLLNFAHLPNSVRLGDAKFTDLATGEAVWGHAELDQYDVRVLEKHH